MFEIEVELSYAVMRILAEMVHQTNVKPMQILKPKEFLCWVASLLDTARAENI